MEEKILLAPFDDPSNLAKNVEAGLVTGVEMKVHDGRVEDEVCAGFHKNNTYHSIPLPCRHTAYASKGSQS